MYNIRNINTSLLYDSKNTISKITYLVNSEASMDKLNSISKEIKSKRSQNFDDKFQCKLINYLHYKIFYIRWIKSIRMDSKSS